jgi:hypothetical protein
MIEAIFPSETSVITRGTRRHIQEDGILHNYHCENVRSETELLTASGVNTDIRSVRRICPHEGFAAVRTQYVSRDSLVCIGIGGVRFSPEKIFLSAPQGPAPPWGQRSFSVQWLLRLGGLTSEVKRSKSRIVALIIHSLIRLYGVELN